MSKVFVHRRKESQGDLDRARPTKNAPLAHSCRLPNHHGFSESLRPKENAQYDKKSECLHGLRLLDVCWLCWTSLLTLTCLMLFFANCSHVDNDWHHGAHENIGCILVMGCSSSLQETWRTPMLARKDQEIKKVFPVPVKVHSGFMSTSCSTTNRMYSNCWESLNWATNTACFAVHQLCFWKR